MLSILALFMAAIPHEISHGWVAWKLGDPTAKKSGRLTLNPLPHIDPVGTVLIPLGLILLRLIFQAPLFIFGWAKPVPIDPRYFNDRERGMLMVGLAGPLTNIALFGVTTIVGRIIMTLSRPFLLRGGEGLLISLSQETLKALLFFLGVYAIINTILAGFNLIPIPPLDGSRILNYFLPPEGQRLLAQLEQFGFLIILALIWFGGLQGLFQILEYLWSATMGNAWLGMVFAYS